MQLAIIIRRLGSSPATATRGARAPRAAAGAVTGLLTLALLAGCAGTPGGDAPSPTSTREPGRLEERIAINAVDLAFADSAGARGGLFTVPAGKVVGIHVKNMGQVEHELMFGRTAKVEDNVPDGYVDPLFESIPAAVFVYMPAKIEVVTDGQLGELELEPKGDLWIRATFPEDAKGIWEVGCFVPGHYEAGMKAAFTIA